MPVISGVWQVVDAQPFIKNEMGETKRDEKEEKEKRTKEGRVLGQSSLL